VPAVDVIATLIAALLVAPFALLTCVFVVEVFAGLAPLRRPVPTGSQPETVIVMPAHDEATIIVETMARLLPELPTSVRLLLVADNCIDDTAALAEAAGAEVIRRHDTVRRGKGYALAFARDHLAADPPQVVMVLDADGGTDRASIAGMTTLALAQDRPVQAVNLLRPDLNAAPMVQVSNFAFVIKNLVRQRALARLAGRVNLTGTGMAFPWPVFRDAPLATSDIVEDLALGLDLGRAGKPPLFAPDSTVWSAASSAEGTLKQRTRWEGGFLATSLRQALPAALRAILHARPRDLWGALSLGVPPLTLLLLLDIVIALVAAALVLAGASPVPALVMVALLVLAGVGLAIAWHRVGRPFLSGAAAARLPLYMLWKVPMYLRLLVARPTTWLRAGR
jgi:cellulose synthase/poly-beta-1,6-N-acetylglucosamine synthase-like glycosyltransferase